MLRRLFTLLSAVSLLLCVGVCVLWVRSYRNVPPTADAADRASWLYQGDRHTARSDHGRVTWYAPPTPPPNAPGDDMFRGPPDVIANGNLRWQVMAKDADYRDVIEVTIRLLGAAFPDLNGEVEDRAGDPTVPRADHWRPLLVRALEYPDRFAAAHYGLWIIGQVRPGELVSRWPDDYSVRPDGTIRLRFDGLAVDIRRPSDAGLLDSGGTYIARYAASIDPAQLGAIRDQWHRRLDVPVASVPHWSVAAATGVLPTGWAGATVSRVARSRSRRRVGRCPRCGYDLRATPGRCPECGTVPPQPARSV